MFKPYKVGTTITDQFMENKLGCFDANILTKNIVDVPSLSKNSNHPTEKPVELMETLVKLVSVEGSTVLDMFAGSGSTGVACVNTNRKGIMIEMDENYFNIGVNRMQESTIKGEIK
jgi:DNA modification methylase